MRKIKFNPELLNEELKRHKLLESYDFYHEVKEEPEYEDDSLILGSELAEADGEDVPDDLQPADAEGDGEVDTDAVDAIASELEVDAPDNGPTNDMEEPIEEPAIEEPVDDAVEVDVTSLVQGSEEAKAAAEQASNNTEMLLQKLDDLEARLGRMDSVTNKIEALEKEIIKRNPTPVEKLEMRSLNSFPYSQKLTDYWKDKEGVYDVMDKKEEYVLKQEDIDYDYSEPNIRKSFSNTQNGYEEEDI